MKQPAFPTKVGKSLDILKYQKLHFYFFEISKAYKKKSNLKLKNELNLIKPYK